MSTDKPSNLFICYAHEDTKFKDQILTQLRVLEHRKLIKVWSDGEIKPGEYWQKKIEDAMAAARVVIFLVSEYSFASDFIMDKELPNAIRHAKTDSTFRLIPIVVRQVSTKAMPELFEIQWAGSPNRPLEKLPMEDRRSCYVALVDHILDFIENLAQPLPDPIPQNEPENEAAHPFAFPPKPAEPDNLRLQPRRDEVGRSGVLKRFLVRNRTRHRVRFWFRHYDPGLDASGQEFPDDESRWTATDLEPDAEHSTYVNDSGFCAGFSFLVIEDLDSSQLDQSLEGWHLFQPGEDVAFDIPRDYFERAGSDPSPLQRRSPVALPQQEGDSGRPQH
jgi:hypothetical protein